MSPQHVHTPVCRYLFEILIGIKCRDRRRSLGPSRIEPGGLVAFYFPNLLKVQNFEVRKPTDDIQPAIMRSIGRLYLYLSASHRLSPQSLPVSLLLCQRVSHQAQILQTRQRLQGINVLHNRAWMLLVRQK